jgi:hypothetical protein
MEIKNLTTTNHHLFWGLNRTDVVQWQMPAATPQQLKVRHFFFSFNYFLLYGPQSYYTSEANENFNQIAPVSQLGLQLC